MQDWLLHGQWFGNPVLTWLVTGVAVLAGYLLAHGVALFLQTRLNRLADRTHRPGLHIAAGVAGATRGWLLLSVAIVLGLNALHFGHGPAQASHVGQILRLLALVLIGAQLAFWLNALLVGWLRLSANRGHERPANPVMLGVLTWLVQLVVWITLLLVLLSEGGVNITAFVASLGIGGVAVALALQNVLTDLFSSIAIGLDKPFEVGEYIQFDTFQGTVMRVGIKSTRIRSWTGEELAISNSVLLKSTIQNWSRLQERRAAFKLRLPLDTPRAKVTATVARVRAIIEAQSPVRIDRGYLSAFGDYSLDLDFAYYILNPDYDQYVTIQQRINMAILGLRDELGITLATPTYTLSGSAAGKPSADASS